MIFDPICIPGEMQLIFAALQLLNSKVCVLHRQCAQPDVVLRIFFADIRNMIVQKACGDQAILGLGPIIE